MAEEDLSRLKIDRSIKSFRPRRRKFIYTALALFLAGLAGFLYREGFLSPADPVEVTTVSKIYPSQSLAQLNATGYVVAQRKAAVASKITGRLVALMVEEGSRVKEGQVIARLENEDALAARNQAEANLKMAQASLEEARADREDAARAFRRNEELWAKQYIARAEYDTSEARYQKSQAAVAAAEAAVRANSAGLRAAEVALDYSFIRAPFDAVVLTKNADIGDIVTPIGAAANAKAAVVTIADLNSLEVEADVSENNLALVRRRQPCEIQLDALPDSRFQGTVHTIVPTVDRTKATITVKIRFLDQDPRILPEMRAKVSFLSRPVSREEEKPRTAVNRSAITRRDGREIVFLIRENRVVETPIKRGALFGEMVEILDGLEPGDRVVNKPTEKLKDGTVIKIAEK
jgi:RND family efflux transporter MFP subunit